MASKRRVLCGLTALIALLTFAGCGSASPPHHSVAAGVLAPAQAQIIETTLLAFEFPVTSSDFARGQNVQRFAQAVEIQELDRCLSAAHHPALTPPPITSIDNSQFPDLAALSQSGFDLNLVPQPKSSQGVAQCASQIHDPTTRFTAPQFLPLMRQWLDALGRVDSTPGYKAALETSLACMRGSGINVATIQDFFSAVDAQTSRAVIAKTISLTTARSRGVQLGQIYAHCMQGSEQVREQMRAVQHAALFKKNGAAIRGVAAQYVRAVEQATAQTGVTFPTQ